MPDALADRLAAAVGDAHVLRERDVMAAYESDWTGRFGGEARLVVRPADASEVAAGEAGDAGDQHPAGVRHQLAATAGLPKVCVDSGDSPA